MYFTSSGYPYIYRNGVAYFHMPEAASIQQPWPVSNLFMYIYFSMDQDECNAEVLPAFSFFGCASCLIFK